MCIIAPSAPRSPQIISTGKKTLQLSWTEPEILNGIIQKYRVSLTLRTLLSTTLIFISTNHGNIHLYFHKSYSYPHFHSSHGAHAACGS